MPAPQGWAQDWQAARSVCAYVPVHTCAHGHVYVCSFACGCASTRGHPGWEQHPPGRPAPGEAPTLREMLSSESLLQRALRDLVASSVSLGASGSVLWGAPSARRSVPASRRPSRCSTELSRGRIWTEAEGSRLGLGGCWRPLPSAPGGHLGGDEVLQPPQQPGVPGEVHGVAVFHPGLQQAEAALVDLGEGRGGVLMGPGGRWPDKGVCAESECSSVFTGVF